MTFKIFFWKALFHSELLACFKCFENLTPISKCFVKVISNPFCVCTSKILRRALFFKKHFPKVRSYKKNLFSSLLKKASCKRVFGFKISKPISKGNLFSKRINNFKLLPYIAKRERDFYSKRKFLQKCFVSKTLV